MWNFILFPRFISFIHSLHATVSCLEYIKIAMKGTENYAINILHILRGIELSIIYLS